MKFLLVFMMCHQVSSTCLPRTNTDVLYNSFRECALAGYEKAREITASMPSEKIEQNQTVIKFWCEGKKIMGEEI